MSVKEQLIELLKKDGRDTWSACEIAETCIKSVKQFFRDNPKTKKSIRFIGTYAVTFKK